MPVVANNFLVQCQINVSQLNRRNRSYVQFNVLDVLLFLDSRKSTCPSDSIATNQTDRSYDDKSRRATIRASPGFRSRQNCVERPAAQRSGELVSYESSSRDSRVTIEEEAFAELLLPPSSAPLLAARSDDINLAFAFREGSCYWGGSGEARRCGVFDSHRIGR